MDLPKFMTDKPISAAESQAKVNAQGPQASEPPLRGLARGGLVALAASAGVFNVLAGPLLLVASNDQAAEWFVNLVVYGVLPGEVGALALWLVWSEGPFLRRLATHWGVGLFLLCGFLLGLWAVTVPAGPAGEGWHEAATAACALPAFSLAVQLPLWPLRTHLGWRVEPLDGELASKNRAALSIQDILSGTAVVAVSLGLVRLAAFESEMDLLQACLVLAVIFGASLIWLLPTTLYVLRTEKMAVGLAKLAVHTFFVLFGLLVFGTVVDKQEAPPEEIIAVLGGALVFAATIAAPLWVLRACKYRLVWPRNRRIGNKTDIG